MHEVIGMHLEQNNVLIFTLCSIYCSIFSLISGNVSSIMKTELFTTVMIVMYSNVCIQ